MYCKTSNVPPPKVPIENTPSEIFTFEMLLSLAILILITVPAGTVFPRIIVNEFVLIAIFAEFVKLAIVPDGEGAPEALFAF